MRQLLLVLTLVLAILPPLLPSMALAEAKGRDKNLVIMLPVNINTADMALISKVMVGVGPQKARAIVEYREQHGPFQSLAQLARVKGIGEGTLARNSGRITVD